MSDALTLAADILAALAHLGWVAVLMGTIAAFVFGAIALMVTRAPLQAPQDDDWDARDRQWHYLPERECECQDGDCLACTIERHPAGGQR